MFSTQLHAILYGFCDVHFLIWRQNSQLLLLCRVWATLDPQSTQIELVMESAAAGASFQTLQRIQTERTCRQQPGSLGTLASLATAPCVSTLCRVGTSQSGLASTCCARRVTTTAFSSEARTLRSIQMLASNAGTRRAP